MNVPQNTNTEASMSTEETVAPTTPGASASGNVPATSEPASLAAGSQIGSGAYTFQPAAHWAELTEVWWFFFNQRAPL